MNALSQLWGELERRIRAIVMSYSASLPLSEYSDTINYLDAREYALALDCLCYGLAKSGNPLNSDLRDEILDLAKMMDIDPADLAGL